MVFYRYRSKNGVLLGASIQMGTYSFRISLFTTQFKKSAQFNVTEWCQKTHNQRSTIITCLSPLSCTMLMCNYNFSIFFFRQSLVLAGLGDLSRPANQLSIGQSASLLATGVIWSRYSLVIIPKNYSLFAVNVFVALTQLIQLGRAYNYSVAEKSAEKQPKPAQEPTPTKN